MTGAVFCIKELPPLKRIIHLTLLHLTGWLAICTQWLFEAIMPCAEPWSPIIIVQYFTVKRRLARYLLAWVATRQIVHWRGATRFGRQKHTAWLTRVRFSDNISLNGNHNLRSFHSYHHCWSWHAGVPRLDEFGDSRSIRPPRAVWSPLWCEMRSKLERVLLRIPMYTWIQYPTVQLAANLVLIPLEYLLSIAG